MIERAVILAAGLGLRLKPLTDQAPKCLTEVNGTPILLNALHNLALLEIDTCTIVIGYLSTAIRDKVGDRYEDVRIRYVVNERYRTTNDLYSLWLARHEIERGALILEGDIFFEAETLKRAYERCGGTSCYLVGKYNGSRDEVLIETDSALRIESMKLLNGRCVEPGRNRYMSSGMLLIQPEYGRALSRWISDFVRARKTDLLFDAVIAQHTEIKPLHVCEINHEEWVEIDTLDDLARAERIFRT
jgi:choline kinase